MLLKKESGAMRSNCYNCGVVLRLTEEKAEGLCEECQTSFPDIDLFEEVNDLSIFEVDDIER